jgi:predicted phosphoribosyltransferase
MYFTNRSDAGQRLAEAVAPLAADRPVVLGLPGGGVPVAYEVARALGAPLDVLVVRKLGAPGHEELAIGAVGPGVTVIDDDLVAALQVPAAYLDRALARERAEVERRMALFSEGPVPPAIRNRTVLLVDDGIATGATALAAVRAARMLGATRVVVAAPVASAEAVRRLREAADDVVCLATPFDFQAVGHYYRDFGHVSPEAVRLLLGRARSGANPHVQPAVPD